MSCIVADSGPLIALAGLNLLDLPVKIYGKAWIPQTVFDECTYKGWRSDAQAIEEAVKKGLLELHPDPSLPECLMNVILDKGELSALALAAQLDATILMDEARGRVVARELGLSVLGVCGLLLLAKKTNHINMIKPLLFTMRNNGYFLKDQLIQQLLSMAGE